MSTTHQIVNGISYKTEAPYEVVVALEEARLAGTRIAILYGDPKTGKAWGTGEWKHGYVGQGNTSDHLPVLLSSKHAMGGQCIMDASILHIKEEKTNKTLYQIGDKGNEQRSESQV